MESKNELFDAAEKMRKSLEASTAPKAAIVFRHGLQVLVLRFAGMEKGAPVYERCNTFRGTDAFQRAADVAREMEQARVTALFGGKL